MKNRIVFIFLDGFGLAPAGEHNPLRPGTMEFLESCLGSPLIQGESVVGDRVLFKSIDAIICRVNTCDII